MTSSSTGSRMVGAACYSSACWSSSSWKVSLFTYCFTSYLLLLVTQLLFSAFDVSLFLPLLVHPFSVSSRFVLCCHVVTVHYFLILVYVTTDFASSAVVGHRVCLPGQGALMCSQNLAWSSDPLFQQP